VQCHCGGGKFKKQMKKANDSGALIALIIGEDEIANEQVTIKYLREQKDQITISVAELATYFSALK